MCVSINFGKRKFILIELYIRPDSTLEVFEANINAITSIITKLDPEDTIILSGDFNLPNLIWLTNDDENPNVAIPLNATSQKELFLLDSCHGLGLSQINKNPNGNGNLLDLFGPTIQT